jgi:hypothetical protein
LRKEYLNSGFKASLGQKEGRGGRRKRGGGKKGNGELLKIVHMKYFPSKINE